ncbi:MAG: serine/threonine protein kinase, partial [Kofleriaceae bacterium]
TSTTMTGIGAVVGTPAFMPPELATGQPCDGRADLYSLGVILYLLGSGRLPFVSESVHELVAMHGSNEPAPPMTGVPHRLAAVIDRLLQKDPAKRYQTAAHALQALETSLAMMTPSHGIQVWPSDTAPSLGPFPATSSQFEHLDETPLPPSIAGDLAVTNPTPATKSDRRARSETEAQRLVSGETMLAAAADPVPATSQLDLAPPAPAKKPWAFVGVAGVALAGVLAFVLTRGGSDEVAPAKAPEPEVTQPPIAKEPEPLPPKTPEVIAPPPVETGSAAATVTEPAPVTKSNPTSKRDKRDRREKRDKRNAKTTTDPKPPTVTPPPIKETPKDNGAGSGSAKKAPLPF